MKPEFLNHFVLVLVLVVNPYNNCRKQNQSSLVGIPGMHNNQIENVEKQLGNVNSKQIPSKVMLFSQDMDVRLKVLLRILFA